MDFTKVTRFIGHVWLCAKPFVPTGMVVLGVGMMTYASVLTAIQTTVLEKNVQIAVERIANPKGLVGEKAYNTLDPLKFDKRVLYSPSLSYAEYICPVCQSSWLIPPSCFVEQLFPRPFPKPVHQPFVFSGYVGRYLLAAPDVLPLRVLGVLQREAVAGRHGAVGKRNSFYALSKQNACPSGKLENLFPIPDVGIPSVFSNIASASSETSHHVVARVVPALFFLLFPEHHSSSRKAFGSTWPKGTHSVHAATASSSSPAILQR